MRTANLFPRRVVEGARGPLLTVLVALAFEVTAKYVVAIPNPPAILILSLVFSAFDGGILPGLLSAAVAWLYIAVFFSKSGAVFHYTHEGLLRVLVWAATLPATALLVGYQKHRLARKVRELEASEVRLRTVVSSMADAIFTLDERCTTESLNAAAEQLFGYSEEEVVGKSIGLLLRTPTLPGVSAPSDAGVLLPLEELPIRSREMSATPKRGEPFPVEVGVTEMTWHDRRLLLCTVRDIRERKRVDEEQRRFSEERGRLQAEIIEAQADALAELSCPLIPVKRGILVMPLVGAIGASRAARVIEMLLQSVVEHQAHSAIIDVTGVELVDTHVAYLLIQAARSVELLGARVVLTGIRPDVARTLVGLGVDLSDILTCGTLEHGIAVSEKRGGGRRCSAPGVATSGPARPPGH